MVGASTELLLQSAGEHNPDPVGTGAQVLEEIEERPAHSRVELFPETIVAMFSVEVQDEEALEITIGPGGVLTVGRGGGDGVDREEG